MQITLLKHTNSIVSFFLGIENQLRVFRPWQRAPSQRPFYLNLSTLSPAYCLANIAISVYYTLDITMAIKYTIIRCSIAMQDNHKI
jgi:hypothetical protein